ncbi:hypothetical protein ACS3SW_05660 [Roseobacteraceae bacterium S113]
MVETIEGADVTEGDFPRLLPLDEVLDAPDPSVTPALEEEVVGRVDALRARASRLSRPVIDRPTRTRMERGVIIDPATR